MHVKIRKSISLIRCLRMRISSILFCAFLSAYSVQLYSINPHVSGKDPKYLNRYLEPVKNKKEAYYTFTAEQQPDGLYKIVVHDLSGNLKMEGFSRDALGLEKHGNFTFYYSNGNKESEGAFANGIKSGVWQRYANNGDTLAEKVYEDYLKLTVLQEADEMPAFPGGDEALHQWIKENVHPDVVRKYPGEVTVAFTVSHTGAIENIEIIESLAPDADLELLGLVARMPAWAPGKSQGRATNVRMVLPIRLGE